MAEDKSDPPETYVYVEPTPETVEALEDFLHAAKDAVVAAVTEGFKTFWENIVKAFYDTIDPGYIPEGEEAIKHAASLLSISHGLSTGSILFALPFQFVPGVNLSALARIVDSMYWTLGLGFMGWTTIAPPIRRCILEPLSEYYHLKYLTRPPPLGALITAYRLGFIVQTKFT